MGAVGKTGHDTPAYERAGAALLSAYDWKNDGFGGLPMVPQPAAAEFLMALGLRKGTPLALKAALRSLAVLCHSELADPVEGGFFDRCEGPKWKGPYTRKSLAVNSALIQGMSTAGAWAGDASLMAAARATVEFVNAKMGAEGTDLWVAALAPDDDYYAKMEHRRGQGDRPLPEGPASAGDNARAISALVRAGICLDEPRFLARARLAGRELFDGEIPKSIADRVAKAVAALDLYTATGDRTWLTQFTQLAGRSTEVFWGNTDADTARPRAELLLTRFRSDSQEDDRDREPDAKLAEALVAPPGSIEAAAAVGMAAVVAGSPPLDVRYRGPPPSAPAGKAVRAALSASWAIGPPAVVAVWSAEPSREPPAVSFLVPGKQSGETSDPRQVRALLRSVVELKEAI